MKSQLLGNTRMEAQHRVLVNRPQIRPGVRVDEPKMTKISLISPLVSLITGLARLMGQATATVPHCRRIV